MATNEAKYCIDSCYLITWIKIHYPKETFPTLWNKFEESVNNDMIVSSEIAYKELKDYDDWLSKWVKQNKKIFIPVDDIQQNFITEIQTVFPNIINPNSQDESADPFIIALAKKDKLTVLTCETAAPKSKKSKNTRCLQTF